MQISRMNTINSLQGLTQELGNNMNTLVPSIFTTSTTKDFNPNMDKLTSPTQLVTDEIMDTEPDMVPTLAETALSETAIGLKKRNIKFTDKEFSNLTINQAYNNTIKTSVSIINDISELISQKEAMTNTEFRRRLVDIFFKKERRIYVGILFIILSFILYFIDSSV